MQVIDNALGTQKQDHAGGRMRERVRFAKDGDHRKNKGCNGKRPVGNRSFFRECAIGPINEEKYCRQHNNRHFGEQRQYKTAKADPKPPARMMRVF
jgi:hypothetical protein